MTYDYEDARRDKFHEEMRREIIAEFEAERLEKMSVTIFYSWQSDTPNNLNRGFIEKALEKAVGILGADLEVQEAMRDESIEVDKDTQGVAGTPHIVQTILDKISQCSVFVPDFTFIAKSEDGRLVSNPNVCIEYGWAVRHCGLERMLPVMNTAFGGPEGLPFDMRHLRKPTQYLLQEGAAPEEVRRVRDELAKELAEKIKAMLKKPGPRGSAAAPEPPSFVAYTPELSPSPSQFWDLTEAVGVLDQSGSSLHMREGERLFLRLIPTATIEPIKSNKEARDLATGGRLFAMTNEHKSALPGRNGLGVFVCECVPHEFDKNMAMVTNATQLFFTRELWGIDATTISSKRLKEAAGVDFGFFPCGAFERVFVTTLTNYLDFASRTLKIPPPLRFIAGTTNVARYKMSPPPPALHEFHGHILKNNLIYEGKILDYSQKPTQILRPFFEKIWDECGLVRPDVDSLA